MRLVMVFLTTGDFSDFFKTLQDDGQMPMAQRGELAEKHEEKGIKELTETRAEKVTLEILREIEILSETGGRHIFHLAKAYVPSMFSNSAIRWENIVYDAT